MRDVRLLVLRLRLRYGPTRGSEGLLTEALRTSCSCSSSGEPEAVDDDECSSSKMAASANSVLPLVLVKGAVSEATEGRDLSIVG